MVELVRGEQQVQAGRHRLLLRNDRLHGRVVRGVLPGRRVGWGEETTVTQFTLIRGAHGEWPQH